MRGAVAGDDIDELVRIGVRVFRDRLIDLNQGRGPAGAARERQGLPGGAPHVVLLDEGRQVNDHRARGRRRRWRFGRRRPQRGHGLWTRAHRDLHIDRRPPPCGHIPFRDIETIALECKVIRARGQIFERYASRLGHRLPLCGPFDRHRHAADRRSCRIGHEDCERHRSGLRSPLHLRTRSRHEDHHHCQIRHVLHRCLLLQRSRASAVRRAALRAQWSMNRGTRDGGHAGPGGRQPDEK